MGWDKQKLIDIVRSMSKEMRDYNLETVGSIVEMLSIRDNAVLNGYFTNPSVDMPLLVESRLYELNSRNAYFDDDYQQYLKLWKTHRGY